MSKFRVACAAALIGGALAGPAAAQTEVLGGTLVGSIAFTTDYVFRGISQTDNDPAVQGLLEYSYPVLGDTLAVYGSAWGSNIAFRNNGGTTVAGSGSLEVDWTVGVRGTLVENLTYDLNAIYYSYPGSDERLQYDNWDFGLKLGYDFGVAAPYVGARYSPDYFGGSDEAWYLTAGVGVPVPVGFLEPYKVKLLGEINRQTIKRNATFGAPDYTAWMAGVTANVFTLDFTLQYWDTNISRVQCSGGLGTCDSRVVFTVGKAF